MQEATTEAAGTAAERTASSPPLLPTAAAPASSPSMPTTLTGGSLLALLPGGTDRLVASFLGAPQGLYCLACSHRNLGRFIAFVERLDNLTPERLDRLLAYFHCGFLPDGNGESDAHVDDDEEGDKKVAAETEEDNGETEQQERLTLLRHLHFGAGYEWASSGGGGEERGSEQIQSRTNAAVFGHALKQRRSVGGPHLVVPKLESLDLSETFMGASDLDCIIDGLGRSRPLRTLLLPGFSSDASRSKSRSSVGETAILSKLPHLREIGNRHGTGAQHLMMMNSLKAQAPAPEQNARLEIIDFARRYGGAQDVLKPVFPSSLFPSRHLLPSLRVLRLDGPLQTPAKSWFSDALAAFGNKFTREVGESFKSGALAALEELSLTNCVPDLDAQSVMGMANGMAQAPVDGVRNLQVLRLRGYALGGFEGGVALLTAFTGMNSPQDGRWAGLRVLDLSDNLLGDIGVERLAESIALGVFGPALEELDLSLNRHIRRSQQSTIGPAGIRALVNALQARRGEGGEGASGITLKRLRLGGQYLRDDGVAELVAGWKEEGPCCWDALEELKLNENGLTDESVGRMVAAGMVAMPLLSPPFAGGDGGGGGGSAEQSKKQKNQAPKLPVLQRLVLERNEIRGDQALRAQLQHLLSSQGQSASSWAASLKRLNLARNPLTAEGMAMLLTYLAPSLQELKLGGNENEIGDNDAMVRKLWAIASASSSSSSSTSDLPAPSVLSDLRRLDIRRLPISRAVVEEFMAKLGQRQMFPRLCQLELSVADVRRKRDMAILTEELKEARGPRVVWDVLTINKTFP